MLSSLMLLWSSTAAQAADAPLILVEVGELPVLITAPHGGTTMVPGVPVRESRPGERVNLRQDELTRQLAIMTSDELEKLTGKRPSLVVAEFSRQSLDANRPEETAYQHGAATVHYQAYHRAVETAVQTIRDQWQHGLLVDLHAQWLRPQTIMRGTRDGQTVQGLIERHGWDGLLGPTGLVGSLGQAGIDLFPRMGASEGQWTHDGSYTVAKYGNEGIDAIQLEIGSDLCDTPDDIKQLAPLIAKGIEHHLRLEQQLPTTTSEVSNFVAAADEPEAETPASKDAKGNPLTEAEEAFVNLLSDAVLVGRFSIDGVDDKNAQPERYKINKVTKVRGKHWTIEAQITYGKVDLAVPVPVEVHWADDTPVISLTDLMIPGLGEGFTTRVLFYKDRYAGSWYHGKIGGHMWGKIEKAPPVGLDSSSDSKPE
ncbi:MAG: N-formylglutamate amidohydrolase [Planctomycetaceae bacterium]|nr:N-formylglutamate amidohydrolase [Planctomycetaceae bacterium]